MIKQDRRRLQPQLQPEFLGTEDCEVTRTAEELIAWIESIEARIDALPVPKTYEWMEKELPKHYFEEIRPLGHLAHHKYRCKPSIYLRPKIGNQPYDAEIIDSSSGHENIARVEIVNSHLDHDHALRMEYGVQHGAVFMTGPPAKRVGTRASGGQICVIPGCEEHQEYLDNLLATTWTRVANKLGKPYPADTILAVVFDDSSLNPEDLPQVQLYFHDILSKEALSKFRGFFILGVSGRRFWEFGDTDSPRSC